MLADRDLRREAAAAALGQSAVRETPLTLVIAAVYARTEKTRALDAIEARWELVDQPGEDELEA